MGSSQGIGMMGKRVMVVGSLDARAHALLDSDMVLLLCICAWVFPPRRYVAARLQALEVMSLQSDSNHGHTLF